MEKIKTGFLDKNGKEICVGDRTRLVLDDGEVREFDVCFKTVKRTVQTLPDFEDGLIDVMINGIFFVWENYNLLPAIDENGICDTQNMEIIE